LEAQLGLPLQNAIASFLSNPDVAQAFGTATTAALTVLTSSSDVQGFAGNLVGGAVGNLLADDPDTAAIAAGVASAVSTAVAGLLGSAGAEFAGLAGSALATVFGQADLTSLVAVGAANALRSWFNGALGTES
jgi:hypothetical protein